MVRTVHLMGKLAQFSKKPIKVDAESTLMVWQCLFSMFGPRFKQMVREGEWHFIKNQRIKHADREDSVGEEELKFSLGKTEDLWVYPTMKASKAVFRVVLGVVLIVVGVVFQMPILIQIGAGLALGGVAEMLAPKPNMDGTAPKSEEPSFMFQGVQNVTDSGGAVPIICGRVQRASSIVLSAGITSEDLISTPGAGTGFSGWFGFGGGNVALNQE